MTEEATATAKSGDEGSWRFHPVEALPLNERRLAQRRRHAFTVIALQRRCVRRWLGRAVIALERRSATPAMRPEGADILVVAL
ncbi:hypothetical protein RHRU231_670025 [Rhodococcus ruber]|uniref:Uncharacterized protein n=1 Tax=Rhodococcus ruber TaxID=1830 RepID=A0A098BR68_9NOCA|nr:hypothetical protein RHRU231_670025 [Rhodococcus ruber]